MLWKLVSANGSQTREDTPTYSVWLAKVDAGEVKEVTMYLSPNSYDLQGEYYKPANMKFQVTIPKEEAPTVTKALRDKARSEEHTSELQSQSNLVCRLLLEKKNERLSRDRRLRH